MQTDAIQEARRQAEICNACRYCEGYCSVFPALHERRAFSDGDITYLANLCHNCRGCYYACQYTAPHEFDLNIPGIMAQVRRESWEDYAWPQNFARIFHRKGTAISVLFVVSFAVLFFLAQLQSGAEGGGFYSVMSHAMMVAIFGTAFVLPMISVAVSLRRYWRAIGGGRIRLSGLISAIRAAGNLKNLKGGHAEGCNFEDTDRFSHARRHAHHLIMYGFLMCFLSTVSGTIMHYGFDWPAPYGFWTPPKLLGVPGGILMVIGTVWMAALKIKADRALGDEATFGGDMAFILLLFLTAASGLLLYLAGQTDWLIVMLAFHLGSVLCLFLVIPYSKMVHGFYRLLAMVKSES